MLRGKKDIQESQRPKDLAIILVHKAALVQPFARPKTEGANFLPVCISSYTVQLSICLFKVFPCSNVLKEYRGF